MFPVDALKRHSHLGHKRTLDIRACRYAQKKWQRVIASQHSKRKETMAKLSLHETVTT